MIARLGSVSFPPSHVARELLDEFASVPQTFSGLWWPLSDWRSVRMPSMSLFRFSLSLVSAAVWASSAWNAASTGFTTSSDFTEWRVDPGTDRGARSTSK